ncbi:MAG: PilZ domain-containing protein [Candidatus Omnitrophota bacterium]
MKEKRKYNRLQQTVPVRHSLENEENIRNSQAKDISTGGMRIASDFAMDIGSRLNLEMHVTPTGMPYYARGEVVWCRENGDNKQKFDIGVKFVKLIHKKDVKGF